jgi:hypothetical protein
VREEALKTKREKVEGMVLCFIVMHSTVSKKELRISGTRFFSRDSSFCIPAYSTDFLFLAQVKM